MDKLTIRWRSSWKNGRHGLHRANPECLHLLKEETYHEERLYQFGALTTKFRILMKIDTYPLDYSGQVWEKRYIRTRRLVRSCTSGDRVLWYEMWELKCMACVCRRIWERLCYPECQIPRWRRPWTSCFKRAAFKMAGLRSTRGEKGDARCVNAVNWKSAMLNAAILNPEVHGPPSWNESFWIKTNAIYTWLHTMVHCRLSRSWSETHKALAEARNELNMECCTTCL